MKITHNFINFPDILKYWAKKAPNKVFIIDLPAGEKYSYFAFNKLVNSAARFFLSLGVKKGDIASICLRNSSEFLISYFALMRVGAIVNPIPSSIGVKELYANIKFLKSKLSLLEKEKSERIKTIHKIFEVKFRGKDGFLQNIKNFSDEGLSIDLKSDDPACLFYSSGTTAKPKGIIFSNRSLINIILLMCQSLGHNSKSIHFGILPMGHTAAMHHSVLSVLYVGGTFVFAENFMKVRKDFWKIIEKYKINYVQTVPTVIYMITNITYKDYERKKMTLSYIACGSAPISEETKKSFEKKFGLRLAILYGLSETGHLIDDYPFKEKWRTLSVGRPIKGVNLKIINNKGRQTRAGKIGEIVVKTPGLFVGYYKNEDLYKSSFKDGYFCTGDLAKRDKGGLIYYVGRKKDLIIKGGVNISPNLIDEILIKHPAVAEAASVGKPDKFFGETVKSFVVLKNGQKVKESVLLEFCSKELGDFKSPSEIEFIGNIPKTASGKILRRELTQKTNRH
jgi:acyl-coenzyme A synthetase/AMP-(fatty) acid ligase